MFRGGLILVFCVALCAALSACSKTSTQAEDAARRGVLLMGNSADPESLDPALATGFSEMRILNALFEGLVRADTKTLEPKPAVAKSWKISDDGLHYTFFLDPRAKWSDGEPVLARDFVFAWRRALNPSIASEYASMLYSVKNARAIAKGEERDFSKLGVRAPDAQTLEVELERPCGYFVSTLYNAVFFPLPQRVLEKFGADKFPNAVWTKPENIVSNGAFVLEKWRINDKVRVAKNPLFRDADAVKLNAIEFFPISNLNTEDRAFRAGQLHITDSVCPHRVGNILRENPAILRRAPWLGVYYYLFNTRVKPFDDWRVRKALSLAIDRRAIIDSVLRSGQSEAYAFVPDGCGGMHTSDEIEKSGDVRRARELLAQAGYPDGRGFPKIRITYNVSEQHKPIAEAVQNMWRKNLGIEAELYNLSWPAYLAARRARDFEVARASWVGDFAEPENFLDLFSSGNPLNHSGWKNADFDALLSRASRAKTKSGRLKLLRDAEVLMTSRAPVMPIYFYSKVYLISPMLKNWDSNLLDYHDYKGVYLDATAK